MDGQIPLLHPCHHPIFFEEIDGLVPIRSLKQHDVHNSIVSTLLALDALVKRGQVILIGILF